MRNILHVVIMQQWTIRREASKEDKALHMIKHAHLVAGLASLSYAIVLCYCAYSYTTLKVNRIILHFNVIKPICVYMPCL